MNKDEKINLLLAMILTGFVASVFFHYVKGAYLHMPYPHNTFLFTPDDRFMDFFNLLDWNKDRNPYLREIATAQYPLLNLLSFLLSLLKLKNSFIIYNVIVIGSFVYLNSVALAHQDKVQFYTRTCVVSFLTYPFLFTVDRGNFESLLCVFLLLFMYFYQKEHYKTSTVFLSCAIAMKLFPVVLLVLLLSDKKYKETLLTILGTLLLTIVCLATFKGGLYANAMAILSGANIQNNTNIATFVGNNNLVQRGVSLFTFSKVLFCQFKVIDYIDMIQFMKVYKICMVAAFFFISLYVTLVERELWKKVALLVFAMLLFPQISADYKLMHVIIPLLIFINSTADNKLDLFYTIMFSLLLIPQDYAFLKRVYSDSGAYDISIGVILNPLIMIAMMAVIIHAGCKSATRETIKSAFNDHIEGLKALGRVKRLESLK